MLEEMPPFPERDSSILAILKKKKPGRMVEPIDVAGGKETPSITAPQQQQYSAGAPVQHQNGQTDLLVDVLGDMYSSQSQSGTNSTSIGSLPSKSVSPGLNAMNQHNNFASPSSSEPVDSLKKLVWKNNGVLFESDLVQIGVKAEYRLNLGRMTLFYGNKTQAPMMVSYK